MNRLGPSRQWPRPPEAIGVSAGVWGPADPWIARASSALTTVSGERVARGAFRIYVGIAWLCLMTVYSTRRWFWLDDWSVLAGRDGGDLRSVFEPYNGHLLALPIWGYRGMLNLFGLRWGAFLAVVVTLHLSLVCVLRTIMRRVGVSPWTATIVAGTFALYGAGEEVLLWPFLIERVGAVLFGLLQLLLADHDGGGLDRRDALGVACGAMAILSSGTSLVVVAATATICLLRHGRKRAMMHALPLALVYGTWYVTAKPYRDSPGRESAGSMLRFALEGSISPIRAVTQHDVLAVALTVIVVAGWRVLARVPGPIHWRRRAAVPLVLLGACPAYYLLIATGRTGFGLDFARGSRYLYVGTALVLPAIALGIDALARRAPGWRLTALLILLVGVPANIRLLDHPAFGAAFYEHERQVVLGIARDPRLDETPGWVAFNWPPVGDAYLTVDWLRDARDRGWLPYLGPIDPSVEAEFSVRLGVAFDRHSFAPPTDSCVPRTDPLDLTLHEGDQVAMHDPAMVTLLVDGRPASTPVSFTPADDTNVLVPLVHPIDIRVSAPISSPTFTACRVE